MAEENQAEQSAQYKRDRVKEVVVKVLISASGLFLIGMITLAVLGGVYGDNPSLERLFGILAFVCLGLAAVCIIFVFVVGKTIKTSNNKDWKIEEYTCGIDGDVRERCRGIYGEVHNFMFGSEDFYAVRVTEEGLKKSEAYCFALLETGKNFTEDDYLQKIGGIRELQRRDIYARTLIVCFAETEPCGYVQDVMHGAEYYGLNEILVLCTYDKNSKVLKVNKTKNAYGNKGYADAYKELRRIFAFEEDEG